MLTPYSPKTEHVKQLFDQLSTHLSTLGIELIKLKHSQNASGQKVRLFVDVKDPGSIIDLNQITMAHRSMLSLIPDDMEMEVSSPGLDRPLTKRTHFVQAIGKKIKVSCTNKVYTGILAFFNEDFITIQSGNKPRNIDLDVIREVNTVFQFTKGKKK